jgi:hypothetical protein
MFRNLNWISLFKTSNIIVTLKEIKDKIYTIENVNNVIHYLEEQTVKNLFIKVETKTKWYEKSIKKCKDY